MKKIVFFLMMIEMFTLKAQPSNATIVVNVKSELGQNCTQVTITGTGKTVKEYEDGVWVNYFRIPVNAILKTDMQGVTRLMKGAAVYTVNGSAYQFKKYNTASGEYIGLKTPNEAEIKKQIYALPDLALGGRVNNITDVESISINTKDATWHTLLSVSVKADYVYWYKKSNTVLEQVSEPFELRLYRKDVNSSWYQATCINPNAANDSRKKQVLSTKPYVNQKTILEKNSLQQTDRNFQQLPDVDLPAFNNVQDVAVWLNNLLVEGNAGKSEKMFLLLIHPSQKNGAGFLNAYAADLLTKMKMAVQNDFSTYNKQYCPTIDVKEKTVQTIEWWNKDKTKSSRLSVQQDKGKWFIADLSINIWQNFNPAQTEKTMNTICK